MEFEVTWSASGTAIVEADSQAEAERKVQRELLRWQGQTLDLVDVEVEAVDT